MGEHDLPHDVEAEPQAPRGAVGGTPRRNGSNSTDFSSGAIGSPPLCTFSATSPASPSTDTVTAPSSP